MNPFLTITTTTSALFAIILTMTALPSSTSALLFSPLLMRANNPWGIIIGRQARTTTAVMTPQVTQTDINNSPSSGVVDFGHDEDLMRYKHELMGYVYEKSLTRGFDGNSGHIRDQ
mmetsp:Transcript_18336/g.29692  ORF Transcript_18336/g.29692 Transcript_18336/m.29692 type:complete len:116 (-) Transcript_18336:412-759(-)